MIKRAFITGGSGFIGSRLAHRLVEMGIETHLSIREHSNLWRLQPFQSKLYLHVVDLCDQERVDDVVRDIQPDCVVHSACYGGFSEENHPLNIFNTNLLATQFLLESCTKSSIEKFIYLGSSSEYGLQSEPITEETAAHPVSLYGIAKLAATQLTQFYARQRALPATVLRIFSPYGPFDSSKRLIPQVIKSSLLHQPLILGSGKQVRDFIYIEDLIDAVLLSLHHSSSNGEIMNVGSGIQRCVYETVQSLGTLLEHPIQAIWNGHQDRDNEPVSWVADIAKAKRILGWSPQTPFNTGLNATIEWIKTREKINESL